MVKLLIPEGELEVWRELMQERKWSQRNQRRGELCY